MLKCLMFLGFIALGTIALRAQQIAKPDSLANPFGVIEFGNRPTEVFTVKASYRNNFGPLNDYHLAVLESINKIYGLDVKKFHYSITIQLDGSAQLFDVPCCDEEFYKILSTRRNSVNRLKVQCVVYRFYTVDGTTNFFYINKASLAGM